MAQDNQVPGDYINVPKEFLLLKNKYTTELASRTLDMSVLRSTGSENFMADIDKCIKDIAHCKQWLGELQAMIESFRDTKGGDND